MMNGIRVPSASTAVARSVRLLILDCDLSNVRCPRGGQVPACVARVSEQQEVVVVVERAEVQGLVKARTSVPVDAQTNPRTYRNIGELVVLDILL